jgi:hypothetical protein
VIGKLGFFLGLIFLIISWAFTYPISLSKPVELILYQFPLLTWLGESLLLIGVFLIGFYSTNKNTKIICASIFPIILYSYTYFFPFTPTSDSGNIKASFEVMEKIGLNTSVYDYFEYPISFIYMEIFYLLTNLGLNLLTQIIFTLYGILLGLFLYLILLKTVKNSDLAFISFFIYFIIEHYFLNYQVVPQTQALIYLLLLFYFLLNYKSFNNFLFYIILLAFIFTHAFLPVFLILFLALYSIIFSKFRRIFILSIIIYVINLIYYTIIYYPLIIKTLISSFFEFLSNYQYNTVISRSLQENISILDWIISTINKTVFFLTTAFVVAGFLCMLIKKKVILYNFILTLVGIFYLGVGAFFSIFGTRSLQILFIPIVTGSSFFYHKWKKLTVIFLLIILLFLVFSPIRAVYDPYLFQVNEEEYACNYMVNKLSEFKNIELITSSINCDYLNIKWNYINRGNYLNILKPNIPGFSKIVNDQDVNMILWSKNLERDMLSNENSSDYLKLYNHMLTFEKIYSSGPANVFIDYVRTRSLETFMIDEK